ncbi:MAG: cupin domain-containing protein [Acidobacteria bacterium]|nr:MAG: cupin domain-containing protein [Acidobacteriota bacterium]
MRRVLVPCLSAFLVSATVRAQTPPARGTAKPATFKAAALTIQVSDTLGAPLSGSTITAEGPVSREGVTAPDGTLRLINLRAGNYRLRFMREGSITLERDLALRAGESATLDVALSAAPPPPKAPEPVQPPPSSRTLGPPGESKVTPVPLFLEKNFIGGREGRKDSPLGCTETGMATLHQLRDSWLAHTHDDADEWIYVVAGEGALRIAAAEHHLQAGTFSLVPHTVTHAFVPQGRNPLIIISVLSGPACKG